MPKGEPIDVSAAFEGVRFLHNRTPHTTEQEAGDYFARISDYRDGSLFISHFAGKSEWERHPKGDEVVYVLEGETALILWVRGREDRHVLRTGQLLVVPENTWHRFETAGVKLMTVTPSPTDHISQQPSPDD
jgi:mannose-6-phosphate isomerase-like protein (cupin superfamily)